MPEIDAEVIAAKLADYANALDRLDAALKLPKDTGLVYLDTSAHRFMFCYELTWKNLRRLLRLRGIQANSPVMTFREAFAEKWIDDKKLFERMIEDRNIVTHEYFQEKAEAVHQRLHEYLAVMRKVHARMLQLYENRELKL